MAGEMRPSEEIGDLPYGPAPDGKIASPIPYSIFGRSQKRWIALIIGVAMMFSPLSANTYLPCMPVLQRDMDTSLQLINLTVTSYIIFQGIAPTFFAELADNVGRRPVYIITFGFYVAANVGLALQNRYIALLLLRMLQSLGASATVAIGYGVVADIATPAERGRILGPAMVAKNVGPILGPVIGGLLADNASWRWVFWFLSIAGCVFTLALLLFLPETCRGIVGNGSIQAYGWSRNWISHIIKEPRADSLELTDIQPPTQTGKPSLSAGKKIKAVLPNPLQSLRLLIEKDTSLVLSISAIFYSMYYIVQASMPATLERIYGFRETEIGLCYLAIGCGMGLGSYLNGRLMDFNYRATAAKIGFKIDKVAGDDLRIFPIEHARCRSAIIFVMLHTACLVGYGWALQQKIYIAGPLILQFSLGFLATGIYQTFNALLVDTHLDAPSTAAASGNFTRCALSAGGVAAMQPLLDQWGDGAFFSALGLISCVLGLGLVLSVQKYGARWRGERENRQPNINIEEGRKSPNSGVQVIVEIETCDSDALSAYVEGYASYMAKLQNSKA